MVSTSSRASTVSGASGSSISIWTDDSLWSSSQRDLMGIMNQVKHQEITIDQAEELFKTWQDQNKAGKSNSFKDKQVSYHQVGKYSWVSFWYIPVSHSMAYSTTMIKNAKCLQFCWGLIVLTLLMLKLEYYGITWSIALLLMTWLLASWGHQQYVQGRISSTYAISVLSNDKEWKYIFMFPKIRTAVNSLRPSNTQQCHIVLENLVIIGSSVWLIVSWTLGNKSQWNLNQNTIIFVLENAFQNIVCQNVSHFVQASIYEFLLFSFQEQIQQLQKEYQEAQIRLKKDRGSRWNVFKSKKKTKKNDMPAVVVSRNNLYWNKMGMQINCLTHWDLTWLKSQHG